MAVTNESSAQYTKQSTVGEVLDHPYHGRVKAMTFEFTQGSAAGDANSTAKLIELPAGKLIVLTALSQIRVSALGSSRVMDVGYDAYVKLDGTPVVADPDYFVTVADVASGGTVAFTESTTANLGQYLESDKGIVVKATVTGGTIPAGATIKGVILYVNA